MVRDYPEVFRGKTSATVRSTPVPRVILSMFAFLDRMKEMDPDIRYDADAGYVHVTVLDPMDETNPAYVPNKPMSPEAKASHAALGISRHVAGFAPELRKQAHWSVPSRRTQGHPDAPSRRFRRALPGLQSEGHALRSLSPDQTFLRVLALVPARSRTALPRHHIQHALQRQTTGSL